MDWASPCDEEEKEEKEEGEARAPAIRRVDAGCRRGRVVGTDALLHAASLQAPRARRSALQEIWTGRLAL
jgi:hypothetical protein